MAQKPRILERQPKKAKNSGAARTAAGKITLRNQPAQPAVDTAAWTAFRDKMQAGRAAPAAGPAADPGASSSASKPVQPFRTAQDMMDEAMQKMTAATDIAGIDQSLRDATTQTEFQTTQNNTGAMKATAQNGDEAAGRGIFQSSMHDGAVADIEAQRALQNRFLQDQLSSLTLGAEARRTAILNGATEWNKGFNQKQVDNADTINSQIVPADPGTAPQTQPAPAAPPQAQTKPQLQTDPSKWVSTTYSGVDGSGVPGEWHVHADGSKVFVKGKGPQVTGQRPQPTR